MRRRGLVAGLAGVAVALVALRLALPGLVERWVNRELAEMGSYSGQVEQIDLALVRGAYVLRGLSVVKRGSGLETPFLELPRMDISLQWRALFSGELVGEIVAHGPDLNLVQAESESDTQLGAGTNWPAEVRELFPFRFNRVEVRDGTVSFRAPGIEAEESLTLEGTRVLLENVTNSADLSQEAFTTLEVTGQVMGAAPFDLSGRIDPNEQTPTFDINMSIENAELTEVNPWLSEFLNVDAEQGVFSMYTELAAADENFEGYVRPVIENAEIYERGEEAAGPFRRAWEALVDFAANVFKNRSTEQVATQIPLSGELENPDAGTFTAIVNLLRNAFVTAFSQSIENSISLRDVASDADAASEPESSEEP